MSKSPVRQAFYDLALPETDELYVVERLANDILESQWLIRARIEAILNAVTTGVTLMGKPLTKKEKKILLQSFKTTFAFTGARLEDFDFYFSR